MESRNVSKNLKYQSVINIFMTLKKHIQLKYWILGSLCNSRLRKMSLFSNRESISKDYA